MLSNFHLGVVVKPENSYELRRVHLEQQSIDLMSNEWLKQCKEFMHKTEEIDFSTTYKPGVGERLRIFSYEPPSWLPPKNSSEYRMSETMDIKRISVIPVNAVVAFASHSKYGEVMLFQISSKRNVIRPGNIILRKADVYGSENETSLALNEKLEAIHFVDQEKLLLRSHYYTKLVLGIEDSYYEASEKDIVSVLDNELFECYDKKAIARNATIPIRSSFARLRNNKINILDRIDANFVKSVGEEHNVEINISHDDKRIIVPEDNQEIKDLLDLLNERIYRGYFSGNLKISNSDREISVED